MIKKIRGTIETLFQLGLNGPNLKDNSGIIECRNSDDTDFVNVRAAEPVNDQDLVTKKYCLSIKPETATLFHNQSKAIVGTLSHIAQTGQFFGFETRTTILNAEFSQNFFLKAGTYNFSVLGITSNCGIIDWYIDDVLVVNQQDWYSSILTLNVVKTNSVNIPSSGNHVLKGKITGKNPSSSLYWMKLTAFWFNF